jgi:hypothetical protein
MTTKTEMIRNGSEAEQYDHCGRSKYKELDVLQSQRILHENGSLSHAVTCTFLLLDTVISKADDSLIYIYISRRRLHGQKLVFV